VRPAAPHPAKPAERTPAANHQPVLPRPWLRAWPARPATRLPGNPTPQVAGAQTATRTAAAAATSSEGRAAQRVQRCVLDSAAGW
jgi:hypothetical protein